MKKTTQLAILALGTASVVHAQTIVHQTLNPNTVTHIQTALNHISLIELPEPVLRVASGSDDFKIEFHGNTVALRPAKQGEATNLFVWTEHTKSSYELLPPGEVKNAAFIIDQTTGALPGVKSGEVEKKITKAEIEHASDVMVAATMLETLPINSSGVKDAHDRINVRITEVVHEHDGLYVRYTVSNESKHPYRVDTPVVSRFTPTVEAGAALTSLQRTQLAPAKVATLGGGNTDTQPVRDSEIVNRDLTPGQSVSGVVCIGQTDGATHLYRLIFGNDETRPVDAAVVL